MKSPQTCNALAGKKVLFSNAPSPLAIQTYVSANNECTHPDVIDFGSGNTWNGYRYWMAFTPYANTDPATENPSIVVSNDNVTWVSPPGLTNPIDPDPGYPPIWNADTDLVYDPDSDRLICYWKEQDSGRATNQNMRIVYKTSTDGVAWSAQAEAVTWTNVITPAVVRRSAGKWFMWAVVGDSTLQTNYVVLRESSNGTTWGAPQKCNWSIPGYIHWHIDVIWVEQFKQYFATACAYQVGTDHNSGRLLLSTSVDGMNWKTNPNEVINLGTGTDWDDFKFYRATIQYDGSNLRMWYSAQENNSSGSWRIGYTETGLT